LGGLAARCMAEKDTLRAIIGRWTKLYQKTSLVMCLQHVQPRRAQSRRNLPIQEVALCALPVYWDNATTQVSPTRQGPFDGEVNLCWYKW
jgi:hypothetical protein